VVTGDGIAVTLINRVLCQPCQIGDILEHVVVRVVEGFGFEDLSNKAFV
jgi:hypothetical protein